MNQNATYGQMGVPASTNQCAGSGAGALQDAADVDGQWDELRLWLFGGQGYDATGNGSLADLWVYTAGQLGLGSRDQALSAKPVSMELESEPDNLGLRI